MGRLHPIRRRPSGSASFPDRLESWKEIAAYLDRTPRTVQRWEAENDLPVHRFHLTKGDSVYALTEELDAWWESRHEGEPDAPTLLTSAYETRVNRKLLWGLATVMFLLVAGAFVWFLWPAPRGSAEPLQATPLTALPGMEWHASLSPGGSTVAFSWKAPDRDNYDAYLKEIVTDTVVPLADGPLTEGSCSWSPDGRWIAFTRITSSGTFEYLRMTAIRGPEEKLAELLGPTSDVEGHSTLGPWVTWSSDNKWLVVMGKQSRDEPYALFAVSVASKRVHRLTSPPAGSIGDSGPAFSPDGRQLAFHRINGLGSSDVFVASASWDLRSLGESRRIPSPNPHNFTPVWTSDGRELVFSSASSSRYYPGLYRAAVSGSGNARRLTGAAGNAWFPALSHRSGRLAYSQLSFSGDIWSVELQEPHWLADSPIRLIRSTRLDLQPSFSPDGNRIAFVSVRSGTREVWLCDRDGENLVKLTSMGGAHVYAPTWSPDGSRIAFASDRDHNYDLYVISATGGEPEQLTSGLADDTAPSWSQDGGSLLFTSNRTGRFEIWSLPIGGGEPVQVTQHGGGGARLSNDGRFLYFAKSPVEPTEIFRMPAGGGEEVPVLKRSERVTHYAVGDRGIYFITAPDPHLGTRLRFYDFAAQTSRDLVPFSASSFTASCSCEYWVGHGMTVSPDEKTLLFGRLDSIEADLMLVEDFR